MKEIKAEAWDYYDNGEFLCITTNGTLKRGGRLVMGVGIAAEASTRFPKLPKKLGTWVYENGNNVHVLMEERLISFPVKDVWWNAASIELIEKSAIQLKKILDEFKDKYKVILPRPGCGYGDLKWEDVKKVIEPILGECENLIIVSK